MYNPIKKTSLNNLVINPLDTVTKMATSSNYLIHLIHFMIYWATHGDIIIE